MGAMLGRPRIPVKPRLRCGRGSRVDRSRRGGDSSRHAAHRSAAPRRRRYAKRGNKRTAERVNDRSEYRRLVRSRAVYRLLHATTIRSHPPPKLTAEGLLMRRRDAIARGTSTGTSRVERSRGQHLWPLCSRCLRLRLSPSAACRRGDPHPPSSSLAASRAGAARATALRAWRSVPMVEALSMALSPDGRGAQHGAQSSLGSLFSRKRT